MAAMFALPRLAGRALLLLSILTAEAGGGEMDGPAKAKDVHGRVVSG
jgi:hypothetical protein